MTLSTQNIGYWYTNNPDDYLFKDVSITFEKGQVYTILGQSGSGKTTFLSLLAGLDSPKSGQIELDGQPIHKGGLVSYRKRSVSTIFQAYNLLTYMTARQNIQVALDIANQQIDAQAIEKLFQSVGLDKSLLDKPVLKLSGGQQQRVAIVRALASGSDILIADEPTGNLDEETTQDIIKIFQKIAHEQKKTVIIVTHEREVAQASDVTFELKKRQFTQIG